VLVEDDEFAQEIRAMLENGQGAVDIPTLSNALSRIEQLVRVAGPPI
jgi:hypothetical protein